MALSPGIPTSFVPKTLSQPGAPRQVSSGRNTFLIFSLVLAGFMALLSLATFGYSKLIEHTLAGKQAELAAAQAKIDQNTIDEFVRLRDRLTTGKDLLNNHIVLSQFFDSLETITLKNVRFDNLKLVVASDRTAKLEMSGTAKSFNALAAQSNAFAGEKRIKRAIFSGITLKDGLVTFKLTADIDPKLLIENPAGTAARAQQTQPTQTTQTTQTTQQTQPVQTQQAQQAQPVQTQQTQTKQPAQTQPTQTKQPAQTQPTQPKQPVQQTQQTQPTTRNFDDSGAPSSVIPNL